MLRHVSNSLLRNCSKRAGVSTSSQFQQQVACFGTAEKSGSILDAWEKSCYHEMDYTISEDSTVYEAVEKFSGYDVGALIAVDSNGELG
jgi:predicted transcriptional regulator